MVVDGACEWFDGLSYIGKRSKYSQLQKAGESVDFFLVSNQNFCSPAIARFYRDVVQVLPT